MHREMTTCATWLGLVSCRGAILRRQPVLCVYSTSLKLSAPPRANRSLPSVACDLGGFEIAGEAAPLFRRPEPLGGFVRGGVSGSLV